MPTWGSTGRNISTQDIFNATPSSPTELRGRLFPQVGDDPPKFVTASETDRCTFDYFESPENVLTSTSSIVLWFITFVSASVIGLLKGGITIISRNLWRLRVGIMSSLAETTYTIWSAMGVYMTIALGSGVFASVLVLFVAPWSAGGGIPDIKAFLNGNLLSGFLSKRTLFSRLIGIVLVTSCGVMAGPEGPMAHAGLIIGVILPCAFARLYSKPGPLTDKQVYDFATVGSGMGIAAAFNAPLAGTLFALEEAASYWHSQLIARTFFGCIVAAIVGTYTTAGFRCDDSSPFCVPVAGEFAFTQIAQANISFQPWEIPIFIILGFFSGIFSVLICYGILCMQQLRSRIKNKFSKILDVALVFSFTCFLFSIATLASPCVPFAPSPPIIPTISTALCLDPSEINPIAFLLLEERKNSIISLFSDSVADQSSLAISASLAMVTTILTSGLSVPAGLFIPLVITGSLFGRLFGIWVSWTTGATAPGVYAVACAAGLLAGVSRMYIWIAAVMLEACSDLSMTIPITVTIVVSNWVSSYSVHPPLYEQLIERKNIIYLPPADDKGIVNRLSRVPIKTIMSCPAVCFFESEKRYVVTEILHFSSFTIFPVVDESGRLKGTTRRSDLEKLLQTSPDSPATRIAIPISSNPISIPDRFDSLKCYYFFTQLGTKLIVITDSDFRVSGVVTRRNFFKQEQNS